MLLFIKQSLGSCSNSHENANQSSQVIEILHSHIDSSFGCVTIHVRKKPSSSVRTIVSNLPKEIQKAFRIRTQQIKFHKFKARGITLLFITCMGLEW